MELVHLVELWLSWTITGISPDTESSGIMPYFPPW